MSNTSSGELDIISYLAQVKDAAAMLASQYPFQSCVMIAVGIELCGRLYSYSCRGAWPEGDSDYFLQAIEKIDAFKDLRSIKSELNSSWRNGFCHQGAPFSCAKGNVSVTSLDSEENLNSSGCCICASKMIDRLDNAIEEVKKMEVHQSSPVSIGCIEDVTKGVPYIKIENTAASGIGPHFSNPSSSS